ncbi:SDR family NAD(P)-dependent oxidoreductase [Salmonella enterica]|nr:SDR family NAD(P)-dependent oxidoreductase [Salmonella enterica]
MVKYDFSGKVALVTGAASGMGLATVRVFCEADATVVMADIRQDLLSREAGAEGQRFYGKMACWG